ARLLLFRGPSKDFVRAPAPEPLQIDRDVEIAQLAKAGDDGLAPSLLQETRDLCGRQLDPRQAIVVAHAELTEAQVPHERLGGVDLSELLGGDVIAVLKARRQAGEGWLVPRRES